MITLESDVKAASTKIVDLGQTPSEVKASLSAHGKIVILGSKMIYVRKDIKIALVDGKVSHVQ